MKITNKVYNNTFFMDLNPGDCFMFDDEVFVVLSKEATVNYTLTPTKCNSYCFNNSKLYQFDGDNAVIKINKVELILDN